jgi:VIT1/CCC1 family predicted Fe2+/Mn2+ transporter
MLRQTPKKRKPTNQSKILGKITKPATATKVLGDGMSSEKRRNLSGIPGAEVERNAMSKGNAGSPKKRRLEAVGLGIGL